MMDLLIRSKGSTHQRRQTSAGKTARQIRVHLVFIQRQKRGVRFVGQKLERFFHGIKVFFPQRMNEWLDHVRRRLQQIRRVPAQIKIPGADDAILHKNFTHRLATVINLPGANARFF